MYIGIFLGIFLGLLIVGKSDKKSHDWILVSWLTLNVIQLFSFFYDFNFSNRDFEAIQIIGMLLPFGTAPILYFYVCDLVRKRRFQLKRYLYHFVPFLFMTSWMLYCYYNLASDQTFVVDQGFIQTRGIDSFFVINYGLILAFFSFLYPTISLVLLYRHRKRVENEFSNIETVNMNWLRYWIIMSMIGFWVSFIAIWSGSFQWIDFTTSFQAVATLITLNIAVIGFFGLKQTTIFSDAIYVKAEIKTEAKYATSGLSRDRSGEIMEMLASYMKKHEPYLDPELNIQKLANDIGINKNQLSQAINEQLKINFFTYINQMRVSHFKKLCIENSFQNYTLLGIALESGFNSKSSFNGVFKKLEGITPGEYKKSIEKVPT